MRALMLIFLVFICESFSRLNPPKECVHYTTYEAVDLNGAAHMITLRFQGSSRPIYEVIGTEVINTTTGKVEATNIHRILYQSYDKI